MVSGVINLRLTSGFAAEVVTNESAVVENASFLLRSLHFPYEIPHWLCISKFTRLRTVSLRLHGSCFHFKLARSQQVGISAGTVNIHPEITRCEGIFG